MSGSGYNKYVFPIKPPLTPGCITMQASDHVRWSECLWALHDHFSPVTCSYLGQGVAMIITAFEPPCFFAQTPIFSVDHPSPSRALVSRRYSNKHRHQSGLFTTNHRLSNHRSPLNIIKRERERERERMVVTGGFTFNRGKRRERAFY